MSAIYLELNQQRGVPLLHLLCFSVAHRGVTCHLSALPLKAQTGRGLSPPVLQLLLIILLFCCTIYAGSTSIGSLGNFPPAESSQPLLTTDGSVFIHGSFMVWRSQVWNFRLSYMRSFVWVHVCVCSPTPPLKFSKSNIQNKICQENEKLGLKIINMPDPGLQKQHTTKPHW